MPLSAPPPPVLRPGRLRGCDGLALPLLRAPAQQDHDPLAILAEVHPIPRIFSSCTPAPAPSTFEKFPWLSRVNAMVTRAAATAFKPSNHRPNGDRPELSRN